MTKILALSAALALGSVAIGLSAPQASAQASPSGDTLFRQRCAMCHSAASNRQGPLGPNLAGVVGRKAGATSFNYSPQLKRSGLTWNRATLGRYLAAPARLVPGTKMIVAVPNAGHRTAIINYLATAR